MFNFKQISRLLVLGIFLFYYSGTVLFYHSHLINGVYISHSHPFPIGKKAEAEAQTHTAGELATIHLLNNLVVITSALFAFRGVPTKLIRVINCTPTPQNYQNKALILRSLRGPPSFSLFS